MQKLLSTENVTHLTDAQIADRIAAVRRAYPLHEVNRSDTSNGIELRVYRQMTADELKAERALLEKHAPWALSGAELEVAR